MMSLAPVSVHQGRHYYQKDNYYGRGKDVESSSWFGRGAEELGLSGAVSAKVFDQLLIGMTPDGAQSLSGRGGPQKDNRRAALDLTFSAPKSVSIAAFVGGDSRIADAHGRAVQRALEVAEERYSLTRTGSKEDRRFEVAGKLLVAQFQHDTSRAKDPQLHTHCVVLNAVRRDDGKWRSLSNEALYTHSKLLGLVYQNELAREVTALGYATTVKASGTFEIVGYSPEQLAAFSKRRMQLEALGARTQREARELVKINRPAKGDEVARSVLAAGWQKEAAVLGMRHPFPRRWRLRRQGLDHREVVKAASRHAAERDVSFRPEALERFALESNLGRVDLGWLRRETQLAEARGELVAYGAGRLTTKSALEMERHLLNLMEAGREHFSPLLRSVPEDLKVNTKGFTAGQKKALITTVSSGDQFLAWQGVAGAGKTFAMKELRQLAEAQGVTVKGFAPSAEAAKVLQTESGLEATTIAALLVAQPTGVDRRGREVWIVDEAGLLSARDAVQMIDRAKREGARVVLVGDTRQLSAVEAGNPFNLLQQRGMTTVHMTESVRHRKSPETLKRATEAMARGEVRPGLALLEEDITEYRRESTRVRHVAADYLALSAEERGKTLVLAGTNRERELLTTAIRAGLKSDGKLSGGMVFKTLRPRDLTREEMLAATKVVAGDVLVFHKAYRRQGLARGEELQVVSTDPVWGTLRLRRLSGEELTIFPRQVAGFQLYEVKNREVAVGDLVRSTRNDKELGVRNGQDLRVMALGGTYLELKAADGRHIQLPKIGRMHFDHNYVSTVYASQGKTSERVIISADHTFGREAMYVAITRAKAAIRLYTQDKEGMCRIAEVSRAKSSAMTGSDLIQSGHTTRKSVKKRAIS